MIKNELKFIVDVGVGKQVEKYLKSSGYDTVAVRDIDPRMSDRDIVVLAAKEGRIIITMDKDFGELVYHSLMNHKGVLLLRLDDATGIEKTQILEKIIKEYSHQLYQSFAVYQNDKFRIKKAQSKSD